MQLHEDRIVFFLFITISNNTQHSAQKQQTLKDLIKRYIQLKADFHSQLGYSKGFIKWDKKLPTFKSTASSFWQLKLINKKTENPKLKSSSLTAGLSGS